MSDSQTNDPPRVEESVEVQALPMEGLCFDANEIRRKSHGELYQLNLEAGLKVYSEASKADLVFRLLGYYLKEGAEVTGTGLIEFAKDSFSLIRDPERSFKQSADDFYISGHTIKDLKLRSGQIVKVKLRPPRGRDKYLAADEVLEVEGSPLAEYSEPADFDKLTPLFPRERILLDGPGEDHHSVRVLDLVAPLGKGQRGLIAAPPRGGKTILLKQVARAIRKNHPAIELIILLLDERPEEVTDFEETVDASVYSSTFDEPPKRHAQVSELVLQRAKTLVEMGKDVVILLDSLTRLARGYNASQSGGKIMSGGLGSNALAMPRKFFGSARNVEEGGSLTILATALIETESRMDEIIFEEFKGTGNMEVQLDRELAERRVYPAIHIPHSGTRNDDRLYHPDEMQKVLEIRKQLAALPIGDALLLLLKNIKATSSNTELVIRGLNLNK